jgi:hypothetical protein
MENLQTTEQLDFNKVWLMFQETKQLLEHTSLETDKKFQETKQLLEHTSLETDKKFQELNNQLRISEKNSQKRINKLEDLFTGQWGMLVESLVEGKLVSLLRERGIKVKETSTRRTTFDYSMEIDIIAENGDEIVVVEVKTKLKNDDLKNFSKKLSKFKNVFEIYKDKIIYGAIAYLKTEPNVIDYAIKQGFLVIKATGDSAKIINEPQFIPKKW